MNIKNIKNIKNVKNIKNLVLGGGGAGGYNMYGVIKYLSTNNYLNIDDIELIYSVSIGALISIIITLNIDWEIIDDYFIKRPWDKFFNIKPIDLINIWNDKGVLDASIIKDILKPLLTVKNLSENLTLQDYYNYNGIEIHMITVNLNENIPLEIDISYKTHPNLELYKALAMSAAFPLIIKPLCIDNMCFIDGGLINNLPVKNCVDRLNELGECDLDTILVIKIVSNENSISITNESSIVDYLIKIINSLRKLARTNELLDSINNYIECEMEYNSLKLWYEAFILDNNLRKELINNGIKTGQKFIESQN